MYEIAELACRWAVSEGLASQEDLPEFGMCTGLTAGEMESLFAGLRDKAHDCRELFGFLDEEMMARELGVSTPAVVRLFALAGAR